MREVNEKNRDDKNDADAACPIQLLAEAITIIEAMSRKKIPTIKMMLRLTLPLLSSCY